MPAVQQWPPPVDRRSAPAPRPVRSRFLLAVVVAVSAFLVVECAGATRPPSAASADRASGSPVTGRPRPVEIDERTLELSRRLPGSEVTGTPVVLEPVAAPAPLVSEPGASDCAESESVRPAVARAGGDPRADGDVRASDGVRVAASADTRPGQVPVTVVLLSGIEGSSVLDDVDEFVRRCAFYATRTGERENAEVRITPIERDASGVLPERTYRETSTSTVRGAEPRTTFTHVDVGADATLLVVVGPATSIPAELAEAVYVHAARALSDD